MSNEDMGIYTPDAAQEIFVNFIEEAEQEQYFQTLLQLTRKAAIQMQSCFCGMPLNALLL